MLKLLHHCIMIYCKRTKRWIPKSFPRLYNTQLFITRHITKRMIERIISNTSEYSVLTEGRGQDERNRKEQLLRSIIICWSLSCIVFVLLYEKVFLRIFLAQLRAEYSCPGVSGGIQLLYLQPKTQWAQAVYSVLFCSVLQVQIPSVEAHYILNNILLLKIHGFLIQIFPK